MKQRRRGIARAVTAGILCATLVTNAFAASGIITDSPSIGGNRAHLVYAQMGGNRSLEIPLAENSVFRAAGMDTLIARAKTQGTVLAAINGTYFTEYGGGNARLYATILQDGVMQNGVGEGNMLGITWDGKPYIDRVTYGTNVILNGGYELGMWGVNAYYTDAKAVMLFTPQYTQAITVPAGGSVFTIRNNQLAAVSGAGSYNVPSGASLLVYNAGAVADAKKFSSYPTVGTGAVVSTRATASKRSADLAAWNNMKNVMSGGRMLVQNGYNVARDASYNSTITEAKQSPDYVSSRPFVATMKDGRLVLGTATASMYQIAEYLRGAGAVNAMGLDGGASTALYTPQTGYVVSPGRQIACAVVLVDQSTADVKPAGLNPAWSGSSGPLVDVNAPSDWAAGTVSRGKTLGLIPDWLQYQYQSNLTRQEFCVLIVTLIEKKSGQSIDAFRNAKGQAYAGAFTDSADWYVRECASLGIVTGGGDGRFEPRAVLTREQAATILQRTADALGASANGAGKTFADSARISDWARGAVDYVTAVGIMNGDGTAFQPAQTFTREQSYITMVNAYDKIQ